MAKLTESQEGALRRIREQLTQEFRDAGRGSKARVIEKLGFSRNQLDNSFRDGYIKISALVEVLDVLGIELEDFLWDAFEFDKKPRRPKWERKRTEAPVSDGPPDLLDLVNRALTED